MSPRQKSTQEEKKLKEARFAARYMPYFAVLFAAFAINQVVRLPAHNRVEALLRLSSTSAIILYCLSHWLKACLTLQGSRSTLYLPFLTLSIMWIVTGRTLADMHQHKQMVLFRIFGGAVLAVSALCLMLIAYELWDWMRKSRRTQDAGLWYHAPETRQIAADEHSTRSSRRD